MKTVKDFDVPIEFYKENESDIVWKVDVFEEIGGLYFSFDKVKIYNLWQDYPHNFTDEELEIFAKEYPYWREYYRDRFKTK